MPRFILANDIHLSMRNPASRIDNYHDAIFAKMDQLHFLAVKVGAAAILLAGDIFNEKTRVPIALIFQVFRWCKRVQADGIRVISIPGNHDLLNDRMDSLPGQALGLLFLAGAMEDASFKIITVEGVDIGGIPYPDAKVLDRYRDLPPPASTRSILMSHCFALPSAGEYFGEPIIGYSELLDHPWGVFHFGHDHRDNGVHRVGDRWFINIGAISRGALSYENVARDVKCAMVEYKGDSTEASIVQIRLNVRSAGDVFDLALKAQRERERTDIEAFVAQISSDLTDVGPVDFRQKLSALEIPDAVRARVLSYVETAEAT